MSNNNKFFNYLARLDAKLSMREEPYDDSFCASKRSFSRALLFTEVNLTGEDVATESLSP